MVATVQLLTTVMLNVAVALDDDVVPVTMIVYTPTLVFTDVATEKVLLEEVIVMNEGNADPLLYKAV
jgi:hypothetical protein